MTEDHRFASLKGACRKWLSPEEYDYDDQLETDLEPFDESVFTEPDHDGWGPIRPRQPLARLGDLIAT